MTQCMNISGTCIVFEEKQWTKVKNKKKLKNQILSNTVRVIALYLQIIISYKNFVAMST